MKCLLRRIFQEIRVGSRRSEWQSITDDSPFFCCVSSGEAETKIRFDFMAGRSETLPSYSIAVKIKQFTSD